tara:strand:- start:407 stop:595 length:189 start_codon:yes stop_codon:yes gene_type:complete
MKNVQHNVIDEGHQFDMKTIEGDQTLSMRVTSEGIAIDITNDDGEVVKSAYQFWSDLEDMTQ